MPGLFLFIYFFTFDIPYIYIVYSTRQLSFTISTTIYVYHAYMLRPKVVI